uniref:Cx9C motif-containing protein 4, mitochondrial n=1 Tax=Blastobotrys adeninivorans TaxID=409370 RepID=A0A060SXR7_BLAAD
MNECHREACRIQDCIQKNNYDETKCTKLVDALYRCCDNYYKNNGHETKPTACPMPDILARKMKDRNLS